MPGVELGTIPAAGVVGTNIGTVVGANIGTVVLGKGIEEVAIGREVVVDGKEVAIGLLATGRGGKFKPAISIEAGASKVKAPTGNSTANEAVGNSKGKPIEEDTPGRPIEDGKPIEEMPGRGMLREGKSGRDKVLAAVEIVGSCMLIHCFLKSKFKNQFLRPSSFYLHNLNFPYNMFNFSNIFILFT